MFKTTILTGETEVISSGIVISYSNEPISITVESNNSYIKVKFVFEEGDKTEVKATITNDQELIMTLVNFNNSVGTGSSNPLPIGSFQDKAVFLNYRVYALGKDGDRTLHYTFYRSLKKDGE